MKFLNYCRNLQVWVRLIAVDNSYYHFDAGQLERLKAEVAGGEPILLLLHVPLHTPELHRKSVEFHPDRCAYLAGTPEEALAIYSPERQRQQRPTPETTEFIEKFTWGLVSVLVVLSIVAASMHYYRDTEGGMQSEIQEQYHNALQQEPGAALPGFGEPMEDAGAAEAGDAAAAQE